MKKFFKNSYKILDLEYLPRTVISTLSSHTGLLSVMRSLSSSLKVGVTTTLLYTYSPTTSKQEWYTCTNPLSFMEMLLALIPGVPSRNHRLSKLSINASDRWHHNSTKEQGIIRTEEFEQFPHRGLHRPNHRKNRKQCEAKPDGGRVEFRSF